MAHTRGGQAPKRAGQASKSKESGSSAPAKRLSHCIAVDASQRACKPMAQTTVTIPDSPPIFGQSSGNSASTQSAVAPSSPAQRSSPTHEQSPPSASSSPPPPLPLPPHRLLDQFPETKTSANGVFFESIFKTVKITLNRPILESIFGLKFIDTAPYNLSRKVAKDLCLQQFAIPQKLQTYTRQNKAPPYHVLYSEPRLLHYVFFRIFYPKAHSKEAYNEVVLDAIYRLMNGYSVNYASMILSHMYRVANMSRTPSLPYGNLLTRIFTHFKVPMDSEECLTYHVSVISTHSLKTLKFYKTATRGWQHLSDLTPEEASSLKLKHPDTAPAPDITTTLAELKEDYAELRTHLEHLQTEMGLMNRKVDELIRLTSLIHHGTKLAIPFQSTNMEQATRAVDRIILSTSSTPHFR
ncbi:hypothetical protein Cgig2_012149 [Carnegiea gigantea]|uniref:Uncharacterized protein n=1 Tax=Carnegiea gigantea TaxID=171969 RepID=A0A9Q1KRI4_9CARY|nr:hypothetical protein Cgig2_012149 [Carnegiea gigantea]